MRITNSKPWVCGAACVASLLAVSGARADIQFCNQFAQTVFVAMAYPQDDESWISRGWLEVGSGKCFSFDTAIKVNTFYYRAESKPYKEGGKQVTTSWGNEKEFAIFEDSNFQYWGADRKVLNSSLTKFSKGAETAGPVTATVTFEADGKFTTVKIPPTPKGGAN